MNRRTRNAGAFTIVELMIVVATIGLLATMAIPNLLRARNQSQTKACIANLREIDNAKQQWSLEHGSTLDTVPGEADIQPYVGRGDSGTLARVKCPLQYSSTPLAGYSINAIGAVPSCEKRDDTVHPASLE